MLNVYKVMSENITAAIASNGESVTKQPIIKGIRVVPSKQLTYDKDTLFTDENGKAVGAYDGVWPMSEVKFYFDDVDGDANGSFKRDSLTVTAEKLKGGSGNWYEGEFALKGTKTLKKSE